MSKVIQNKLGENIHLPAINRQVLILGYAPRFWQIFFLFSIPVILLGYSFDFVFVLFGIYLLIGLFFAYLGHENTLELEKGKNFYQKEKKYFYSKKGVRIIPIKISDLD